MQKLTLIIQMEYTIYRGIFCSHWKRRRRKKKNLIAWNNQSVSHDRRCMIREA